MDPKREGRSPHFLKMSTIPIYIISLNRTPERRLFMQRQLDSFGLEYQFIDVGDIDKYELESKVYRSQIAQSLNIDKTILENKYNAIISYVKSKYKKAEYEKQKNSNMGVLATTLSHIKIYDLMVKDNIATVCILEDDTTLLPTFPEILETAAKLEWDMLMLANIPARAIELIKRHSSPEYKRINRMRILDIRLLFVNRRTKISAAKKEEDCRIKCLLKEYGLTPHLYPEQSKIMIKALQEYDSKYTEIIKSIAPGTRFLYLLSKEQYERVKTLAIMLRWYTFSQLGALPNRSSLNVITKYHCISEPRCNFHSTSAYLLRQPAAIKWKQKALAENPLAIDQVPWELYRNGQVKLRLITPPCATDTVNYLIYSVRR